jgi:hypothetical protein
MLKFDRGIVPTIERTIVCLPRTSRLCMVSVLVKLVPWNWETRCDSGYAQCAARRLARHRTIAGLPDRTPGSQVGEEGPRRMRPQASVRYRSVINPRVSNRALIICPAVAEGRAWLLGGRANWNTRNWMHVVVTRCVSL